MSIENITADSLRRMNGKEGLVLQAAAAIRGSGWTPSTNCSPKGVLH